ncbi:MAG TPA: methyltransferase domain-containing protein [Gammaproteobacteria bacterium]
MSPASLEDVLPDPRAARRAFDRAAETFDAASVVHDEARDRLVGRLELMRLSPAVIVDLGSGLGAGARQLRARFPDARLLAVDWSLPMLAAGRARGTPAAPIAGAAERLPLKNGQVDLIFANMLLPWSRPERLFREAARTLTQGGLLLFSTLGPDTLEQLRRAWAAVDDRVHVHAFVDMHDLGDLAVASGLAEPVVDVDRMELRYRDVHSVIRDLRSCGAVNVAAGRRRALTGRARWAGFERALESGRHAGRFPVTVELILGHAWGSGRAPLARRGRAPGEVGVAPEDIGIMRRRPR